MVIFSVQNFPALSASPQVKDWSQTSVPTDTSVGMIRRSALQLEATVNEMIDKLAESGKICFNIFKKNNIKSTHSSWITVIQKMLYFSPQEIKKILKYAGTSFFVACFNTLYQIRYIR